MKLLFTLALAMVAVGCGYSTSSQSKTPPGAGNVPTVSALVPASANHGGTAFTLEVDGTQFGSQATVNFAGTSYAATWLNSGKLQAMIPASAITTAGQVQVTVTNPGTPGGLYGGGTLPETSAQTSASLFTIN